MAQEFGDHPERAVIRMCRAGGVAREAFVHSGGGRPQSARCAALETERHLRSLLYTRRLARAAVSEQ